MKESEPQMPFKREGPRQPRNPLKDRISLTVVSLLTFIGVLMAGYYFATRDSIEHIDSDGNVIQGPIITKATTIPEMILTLQTELRNALVETPEPNKIISPLETAFPTEIYMAP